MVSMIRNLKIRNFRGIKEGDLELDDLTIILGGNNAGKTTILEALFLLPNPFREVPYSLSTPMQTIHEFHRTLDSRGWVFFLYKYSKTRAEIYWESNNNLKGDLIMIPSGDMLYFTTTNINKFPSRSEIRIGNSDISYFGYAGLSDTTISYLNNPQNKNISLGPNSLLISAEIIKLAERYLYNNWVSIVNTGIPIKVAKDISRYIWEDLVNITIEPYLGGRLSIFGLMKDGSRIRLGDFGSGAQIYIISKIIHKMYNPDILLWDDVESHMNPKLLSRIAEWFAELVDEGKQVIVTTHSLEAAKMISSFNSNASILLLKLRDGILESRKMKPEELEEFSLAGVDVRTAEGVLL